MSAISPSRLDRPFYGLWRLWEMLELDAGAFYYVTTRLESLRGFLDAKKQESNIVLSESVRINLVTDAADLIEHLDILNARVSLIAARELKRELDFKDITWGEFGRAVSDLHTTLNRELSLIRLFVIEAEKQRYFTPKAPLYGLDFEAKFISASFELDEAAKCLALSRPTACVFHLMRLMEIGIGATARCLSIPDPVKPAERNWGHILKNIWGGIERKWPTTADRAKGDGALFESLHASLDAVKNPWRNATM